VNARVVAVLGVGPAGRALIQTLAQRGDTVVAVNRSSEVAQAALEQAGAEGSSHGVDLGDRDAVRRWVDEVTGLHGGLDGVVHLVGGWAGGGGFNPQALTHHDQLVRPVLETVQVVTTHVAQLLASAPRGFFVMVSSTSVTKATAGNAAYAALKAAAEVWTLSLADHFAASTDSASATILRVKALVDDQMRSERPDATFKGFTDVSDLARAILQIPEVSPEVANGQIIDLTSEGYSVT
jgi:NAD(P)-dependent dehydrogenase (short-subunit alcohol dehydrogenase family)